MKYPKCSNINCKHNYKYLCKGNATDEDIVCKQGKADAIKKIKWSKIRGVDLNNQYFLSSGRVK